MIVNEDNPVGYAKCMFCGKLASVSVSRDVAREALGEKVIRAIEDALENQIARLERENDALRLALKAAGLVLPKRVRLGGKKAKADGQAG